MEESETLSKDFAINHRTVRGTTETCRHQVNERSAWLHQRSMKVNWKPHVFHLHNKKEKKSVRCKSESVYHKIKSVFDSHYQMHIRLTHNRSRCFHISVETNVLFVYISVRTYILIFDIRMDSIISVGIDFRKLKINGYSISWFVEFYQIIFYRIIE